MQAPQDALCRLAMIVLHEVQVEAGRLECAFIIAFVEEAAIVAEYARFDDDGPGNGRLDDVHAIAPLPPSSPIR